MDYPGIFISRSAQETKEFGYSLGHTYADAMPGIPVVCLWGDLGSGKTTFTQGFAKGLGISGRLLSPTYIIVRRYKLPAATGYLYHADFYRINSPEDMDAFGISETLAESGSITIIEWPERMGTLLPKIRLDIRFRVMPDGEHEIRIDHIHT